MDSLAWQDQRLRWLLKDIETIERRASELQNKVRMLRINLAAGKGVNDRIILMEATRARGDSRLLQAWVLQLEGEIRSASRGASMSGSRYGHSTSVHGLASTVRDRARRLQNHIDKIANELDRLYRETHSRFDDPFRHSAGVGVGLEGALEVISKITDLLEMVEKFLHKATHHHH
jgi:hypothetical protein